VTRTHTRINCPLENWRRPLERPHTNWIKTVQQDLKPNDLSMNEANDVAQNRPLCSLWFIQFILQIVTLMTWSSVCWARNCTWNVKLWSRHFMLLSRWHS